MSQKCCKALYCQLCTESQHQEVDTEAGAAQSYCSQIVNYRDVISPNAGRQPAPPRWRKCSEADATSSVGFRALKESLPCANRSQSAQERFCPISGLELMGGRGRAVGDLGGSHMATAMPVREALRP